ncbi:MAG: hypothetical protein U0264_19205 [Candidatus Kapaibacterium sp.]
MKILFLCLLFFITTADCCAQYTLRAGPLLLPKIGINISNKPYYTVPSGNPYRDPYVLLPSEQIGTGPSVDIDYGMTVNFTLQEPHISTLFDCTYNTSSTILRYLGTDYRSSIHYLSIAPMLDYGGFLVGINVGYPLSGSTTTGSSDKRIDAEGFKDMNIKFELRLGGSIPLKKYSSGELNLVFLGNLMISGFYPEFGRPKFALVPYDNLTNPRIWSFSLGLNYMIPIVEQQ